MKLREIKIYCKECGARAYMMTRKDPKKITKEEKEFICNDCFEERKSEKIKHG